MMKMNRKALALLASVMLAASTAGCGNLADSSGSAVEAMASVPEADTTADAGEEPSDTAAPTEEPAATAEPTAAPTATPAAEPAAAPTAEPTTEPASAATPAPASTSGDVVFIDNAPAVAGVVEKTETVTVPAEQASGSTRPAGMPETVYSEEEMLMAMLLYGGVGDGYRDNGDGTYTYYNAYGENNSVSTTTTTVTTDNWYRGSEADILAKLAELQAMYPDGSYWGDDSYYDNPGSVLDNYIGNDNACGGFAKLVSDYCFGCDAPARQVTVHYSEVRPGDIIVATNHAYVYVSGDWHVSDQTTDNGVPVRVRSVAEGNLNGRVHWGDKENCIRSDRDEEYVTVLTRWPE